MSFLAGLLRRELTPAPSAAGAPAGPTSALAVVPRLASRFENPGTAWWPGSGEHDGSGEGHEGAGLERRGERDASAGLRAGTPANDAPMTGRAALTFERHDGADGAKESTLSSAGRPGIAGEASALHSGVAEGSSHRGEETNTVRPDATSAPPIYMPLPAVPSGTGRVDATRVSTVPLFAPATAEGGAGPQRREAGVVRGMERTGENSSAAHSHGDGRIMWQASTEGQVRPRLEPLARREAAKAPEQHIHVSIGRIEVRAVAAAAPQPSAPGRAGLMSLDEYLRDRP